MLFINMTHCVREPILIASHTTEKDHCVVMRIIKSEGECVNAAGEGHLIGVWEGVMIHCKKDEAKYETKMLNLMIKYLKTCDIILMQKVNFTQ